MYFVTYGLILITVIISLVCFQNHDLFYKLAFIPNRIKYNKEYYRFITHGFVHADFTHLLFNMLTLYFFGTAIEGNSLMGNGEYIIFYLTAIIISSLPSYFKHVNDNYMAIGASGAVSAILYVLVLYAPWSTIRIQFLIPMYFILYAVLYLIYCVYASKNINDNIGHDAHFYGAIYGLAFTIAFHPKVLSFFIEQISHPPFLHS